MTFPTLKPRTSTDPYRRRDLRGLTKRLAGLLGDCCDQEGWSAHDGIAEAWVVETERGLITVQVQAVHAGPFEPVRARTKDTEAGA